MEREYTIGTGYYNTTQPKHNWSWDNTESTSKPDLFKIWYDNTLKYSSPKQIVVVDCSLDAPKPSKELRDNTCWIELKDNLGHVNDIDLLDGSIKFCGWTMSFMIGAMIAYNNKTDFIYKEQDCLAFNNWIDVFYNDIHKYQVLYGKESVKDSRVEQSLFWIKWEMIPSFVSWYMVSPINDAGPKEFIRPEHKFFHIGRLRPDLVGYFNIPFGRSDVNQLPDGYKPFYIQQTTDAKLKFLKDNGYI